MREDTIHKGMVLFSLNSHLKISPCIVYIMWSAVHNHRKKIYWKLRTGTKYTTLKWWFPLTSVYWTNYDNFLFLQLWCTHKKHSTPSSKKVAEVFKGVVYEKTTVFVNNMTIKGTELTEKKYYRFQLKTLVLEYFLFFLDFS